MHSSRVAAMPVVQSIVASRARRQAKRDAQGSHRVEDCAIMTAQGPARSEHQFGVAGRAQVCDAFRTVGNSKSAQLDVFAARDGNLDDRPQVAHAERRRA